MGLLALITLASIPLEVKAETKRVDRIELNWYIYNATNPQLNFVQLILWRETPEGWKTVGYRMYDKERAAEKGPGSIKLEIIDKKKGHQVIRPGLSQPYPVKVGKDWVVQFRHPRTQRFHRFISREFVWSVTDFDVEVKYRQKIESPYKVHMFPKFWTDQEIDAYVTYQQ